MNIHTHAQKQSKLRQQHIKLKSFAQYSRPPIHPPIWFSFTVQMLFFFTLKFFNKKKVVLNISRYLNIHSGLNL